MIDRTETDGMFIAWVGGLLAFWPAYFCIRSRLRSKWCGPHGVFGLCRICEEEHAARSKAKAQAEANAEAETEHRWRDIQETYQSMDEGLRNQLTALVLERAEREHLLIRSSELKADVVRVYKRRRNKRGDSRHGPLISDKHDERSEHDDGRDVNPNPSIAM
jgi:hypothetical protein